MTGRPILREKTAGTSMCVFPLILEPKPPPQYSATRITSSGSMFSVPAIAYFVRWALCVDTNAWSLPFSQYIMAERGSIGWWVRDWCTIDSSKTKSDSENAVSISPFVHSTAASPFGIRPASISSKSASVHLSSLNSPPPKRLPPV